jgi:hypothetical protein
VPVTLMNIVQGNHKQSMFMIPLSLISKRLLLPVIQVRGLLPFFRLRDNIRVISSSHSSNRSASISIIMSFI